jgi:2-iminoacetate synthase
MNISENAIKSGFKLPDLAGVITQSKTVDSKRIIERGVGDSDNSAAIALALFRDESISIDTLMSKASAIVAQRYNPLSTFVPLYLTNYCHAQCAMCGMRSGNENLIRKFASRKKIEEQLDTILHGEGIDSVAILTGEYGDKYTRLSTMFYVGWTVRTALDKGFKNILINIGSLMPDEIVVLKDWFDVDEPVMLSVFQETYNRKSYSKFMGSDESTPKTNFESRIQSYENWLDAGFKRVNPGALIGLHDREEELINLLSHVQYLSSHGATIDISMPRLRPANGTDRNASKMTDDQYLRFMASIAIACPKDRIILTTREKHEFQEQAIDMCGVFSPGSPDVTPYNNSSKLVNDELSSQFIVADQRRPSDILAGYTNKGYVFNGFSGQPKAHKVAEPELVLVDAL